ncbi:glycosyltransferase family 4 protein [Patescibacteria group bacterium]|nr:glycosyltransferase family 4 protein [Patescibacteria group bacterium]MBU1721679.1 glycosyltransferase family 4 protein [Patescibacteria group bacterium]MBU1900988.1 glycosyltransferase family 4 protein [Patescibacteria group bacterium]
MNIGIDARMISPSFGIGRYIEQLLLHMFALEKSKEHSFVLFMKKEMAQIYMPLFQELHANIRVVYTEIPWYSFKEQKEMPALIRAEGVDCMHFPHWNVPYLYNDPFVVTVHDLIMYHFPRPEATTLGPLLFFFKNRVHRFILSHAVKKARHVLVPSMFTKEDVHTTLRVPKEKMTVSYEAPIDIKEGEGKPLSVLETYNIFRPHVLYVGAAYPHKNVKGLLEAWHVFEQTYGNDYQLVLVGQKNPFYTRLLESKEMRACTQVIYTDFVPDDQLKVLYETASLFVTPSLYEGFGLPPLEAMKYGVPVVSSDRTCLPEILGEAALYADPENKEQLAEQMYRALSDDHIRFVLKERAKGELSRYSWKQMAEQTLAIYEQNG